MYVFYLPTNIGVLVGITALLVIWAYLNDYFSFADTIHFPSWTVPLWTVLRNLGLKEIMAYFLSSLLFWMAHYKFLLLGSNYSLWFSIPLLAFLFGFMAWRTRSLTPGTIGHFLFNFLVVLYSSVF